MFETNIIQVRYWAAARAEAGVRSDEIPAPGAMSLAQVRAEAIRRHPGTRLAEVLAACSTLVGDQPVGTADAESYLVQPGSSVEFLPPFAGG